MVSAAPRIWLDKILFLLIFHLRVLGRKGLSLSESLTQWFLTFFSTGPHQVQVSRAACMSFTYYVINTNQPYL